MHKIYINGLSGKMGQSLLRLIKSSNKTLDFFDTSKIAKKDKYGSIYSNSQQGLFATDRRASKVGDLLTVALSENFSASKSQSAKSAKNGTTSFDFPKITTADADDTLFDSKLAKSFDGSGSAAQNNSLRGEISVTVTKVFSNGNMEILGQKKLTLNNGCLLYTSPSPRDS